MGSSWTKLEKIVPIFNAIFATKGTIWLHRKCTSVKSSVKQSCRTHSILI